MRLYSWREGSQKNGEKYLLGLESKSNDPGSQRGGGRGSCVGVCAFGFEVGGDLWNINTKQSSNTQDLYCGGRNCQMVKIKKRGNFSAKARQRESLDQLKKSKQRNRITYVLPLSTTTGRDLVSDPQQKAAVSLVSSPAWASADVWK